MKEEKVFLENVFTVWELVALLNYITLPDDLKYALNSVAGLCEEYLKDGFTFSLELEE